MDFMDNEERETVLPSELGFHCDGECWSEAGKAEGLLDHLFRTSAQLRDWFALGSWATEEDLGDWELPPMEEVHPIQSFIVPQTVDFYRKNGVDYKQLKQEFYELYPTLFRWGGKLYIFQGTHRLAAIYTSGASDFRGWTLDLDALTS